LGINIYKKRGISIDIFTLNFLNDYKILLIDCDYFLLDTRKGMPTTALINSVCPARAIMANVKNGSTVSPYFRYCPITSKNAYYNAGKSYAKKYD